MLAHVVLFKFAKENRHLVPELNEMLKKLKKDIPFIRELETGINEIESERACDVYLRVMLDDLGALKKYAEHPDHLPVIAFVKKNCDFTKCVDYHC